MFRMLGNTVELYRHKITWQENEEEMVENCISKQHKTEVEQALVEQGVEFTTTPIDQSGNEWFNGLEFDSYDEALVAFNAGELEYEKGRQRRGLVDALRLRADIDYLAIMTEVEI